MHGPCGLDMDSLKQNRSDLCVCMREARAHAAAGFKERGPGGREPNKRDPYLKMCPPGGAGKGTAFVGGGEQSLGMPDFHPEGRDLWGGGEALRNG